MRNKKQNGTLLTKSAAVVSSVALCGLTLALTGCGVGTSGGSTAAGTVAANGLSMSGKVHGGQQPVTGSTIQLYAVGTTGNGSAATPLLNPAATTNASGAFNITGQYTCPANSLVYITATQGNPGLGTGGNNPALALMAALGSCATLQANATTTVIDINEVTTVAAVYALAGFMTDYNQVGYGAAYTLGITNAFATSNTLANYATGLAPGIAPASGITLPTKQINMLADAASNCVNSTGSSSPGCTGLFAAATPSGGSAPTNTVAALANIAHSPGSNVAAIYSLVNAAAPFQPTLTNAPSDWTLSIYYTGGGLSIPSGVAIDYYGGAWIANSGGNAITKLTTGAYGTGPTGNVSSAIVGPQGIAINSSDIIWLANTGANNLMELNANGGVIATFSTNISGPVAVALDGNQNVWVTNFDSNSVAEFTSSGTPIGSPYTTSSLSGPTGLAIDSANNVWVSNGDGGTLVEFNNSGVYQNAFTDGYLIAPGGVATDTLHSRIWTASTGINALSGFTPTGGTVAGAPLSGGGIAMPLAVAVDGLGNVWTVNGVSAGSVTGYTTTGVVKTPSTGLGSLNTPLGLALDGSGNLWTTDGGDNSVTEFIGLASPTVTPLVNSAR